MKEYVWNSLDAEARRRLLERPALKADDALVARVGEIVRRVREDGDAALRELTREIEGIEPAASFEVSTKERDEAAERLTQDQREAIRVAARNIETFHREQQPGEIDIETAPGVRCQRVTRPLAKVGLYVPAGTAPLPSTALMLGVPAKLAGCPTRILCTPAQADGHADAAVLYAANVAGVQRIFKLGGAQAIAAMAYGTESVPKVYKVFGPGSAWVTAAKAIVDADPGGAARDFPAGPSEVLVVADDSADPAFVAADLLSQAEHGADSQVLLITTSPRIARETAAEVAVQKARLSRETFVDGALEHSSIILVDDLETALAISNDYAPEHLILQVDSPRGWLDAVENAGSVFLGPWAPESVGDYCSGTNHVLPTYGYARRSSSLGLADFMRSMTVQELSTQGIAGIGPVAETLARLEGLDAHAQAVRLRLERLEKLSRGELADDVERADPGEHRGSAS